LLRDELSYVDLNEYIGRRRVGVLSDSDSRVAPNTAEITDNESPSSPRDIPSSRDWVICVSKEEQVIPGGGVAAIGREQLSGTQLGLNR
jgi:hypothetical protein